MGVIDEIEQLEHYIPEPLKPLKEMPFEERWNYELEAKGWIALKIEKWVQDTIILAANDQVTRIPHGYAVYTIKEFGLVYQQPDIHMVHWLKKNYGAVIESVERRKAK